MFARLRDMEDHLLIARDNIAFFDAPFVDGAFHWAVPYAKQNLWLPAR